jgi:hypothetical protein
MVVAASMEGLAAAAAVVVSMESKSKANLKSVLLSRMALTPL